MRASTFPYKGNCRDVFRYWMVAGRHRPRRDFCATCTYRKRGVSKTFGKRQSPSKLQLCGFRKPTKYFHSHMCLWQYFTRAKFVHPRKRPLLSTHAFAWSQCRFFFFKPNVCNDRLLLGTLGMKLHIELFFTAITSFWGVHVQRWAVSLSLSVTYHGSHMDAEAALEYQDFLDEMNSLTALNWQFHFSSKVTVGLKLVAHWARAKQTRAIGSSSRTTRETRTTSRTWRTSPLSKKVRWERGWWRQRSSTRSRKRPWSRKRCWREPNPRGQQCCSTPHLGRCESWRIWTTRIYSTERAWRRFPMIL